jgi:hypothetical protein
MSLHDPTRPRKPGRLGLYGPFLLLLVGFIAWSVFWFWARTQVQTRMDAAVADLGRAGYQISWSHRGIGGYPFRMDVTLKDARVREPSGWGLETPLLEGEAYAYAPTHWMFATPSGLTFVRPLGGPVVVTGKGLRASLSGFDKRPPSFDFQGEGLTFQPAAGAEPFALTAAALVEFHLRAGPDDQGGVFAQLTGGKARLSGLLGRIANDKPVAITWNSTLSRMSAFSGADWPDTVGRWSDAGGLMTVRDAQLTAGEVLVQTKAGTLGAGRDGRLTGSLPLTLRQAPKALGAMAAAGALPYDTAGAASTVAQARQAGDLAHAALYFEAGQATLGPVAIGPAPRVYVPR